MQASCTTRGGLQARPPPQYQSLTRRRGQRVRAFDEGAAQVRRLVDRDRKDLDFDELEAAFAAEGGAMGTSEAAADSMGEASSSERSPPTAAPFAASNGAVAPRSAFQATPFAAGKRASVECGRCVCVWGGGAWCVWRSAASGGGGRRAPLPTPQTAHADKTFVSPFGPSSSSSPFGSPTSKPFAEPAGLSPTLEPDQLSNDPWWTRITVTQIVITLTFAFSIGLMLATFFFVVKVGAVHFNE